MGGFLTKFSDKIILKVSINPNEANKVIVTVNNSQKHTYHSYILFFQDLREYYDNKIKHSNSVAKKAICFDATQGFYVYQELFGIYCDRFELLKEIEFHTKYFQNLYDVLNKLDDKLITRDSRYPNIFNNDIYLNRFKSILEGLNAFDNKNSPLKRGFVAKANAILTYERTLELNSPEKKILLPNISVKEFVFFLNTEFNLGIKYTPNYKLSSGAKHINFVKKFY